VNLFQKGLKNLGMKPFWWQMESKYEKRSKKHDKRIYFNDGIYL